MGQWTVTTVRKYSANFHLFYRAGINTSNISVGFQKRTYLSKCNNSVTLREPSMWLAFKTVELILVNYCKLSILTYWSIALDYDWYQVIMDNRTNRFSISDVDPKKLGLEPWAILTPYINATTNIGLGIRADCTVHRASAPIICLNNGNAVTEQFNRVGIDSLEHWSLVRPNISRLDARLPLLC